MRADLDSTCASIRFLHRQRVYAMEQRKRADLALGSFLRMALGWQRELPKKERDAIAARVKAMLKDGENVLADSLRPPEKRRNKRIVSPDFREWSNVICASLQGRAPFDEIEKQTGRAMAELARDLPVWEAFGQRVCGFGLISLAVIVGEAGNLSAYPKKGHLWKRMGLAVIDGVRQGGLPASTVEAAFDGRLTDGGARAAIWAVLGHFPSDHGIILTDDGGQA